MVKRSRLFGPGHILLLIIIAVVIGIALSGCDPKSPAPTNDPNIQCSDHPDGVTVCRGGE